MQKKLGYTVKSPIPSKNFPSPRGGIFSQIPFKQFPPPGEFPLDSFQKIPLCGRGTEYLLAANIYQIFFRLQRAGTITQF